MCHWFRSAPSRRVASGARVVALAAVLSLVPACCRLGAGPTAVAPTPAATAQAGVPAAAGAPGAAFGLTPILVVDAIEPCLEFWVDRLGFERAMEVSREGALGFVALERGGAEVMLQSRASLAADVEEVASIATGLTVLYVQVPDLDDVARRLGEAEIVVPMRTTAYGMREVWVREPGGHVVGFAEPTGPAGEGESEGGESPAR